MVVRTPAGLQNPLPNLSQTEPNISARGSVCASAQVLQPHRSEAAPLTAVILGSSTFSRRGVTREEPRPERLGSADSPDGSVEAEAAEAVSALGLQGPAQDLLTRVAQVLVFEAVGQDFPREARLVALQGGRRRRLLLGRHYSGTEPDSVGCVQERKRSRG